MKKIIPYVILLILGIVAGWLCRDYHFRGEVEMVQTDTLVIRDTHIVERIVEKERRYYDTMYVAIRDTIVKNDTTYLPLPRESRTYGDERFTAVVSGYQPSLDRLEIYLENQVVTQYLKPVGERVKRNTLSLGIEASYLNALSIPIYLEYERMLHKNVGIYGQIFYDLPTRQMGAGLGVKAQIEW
jgi:hypothetical protein